MAKHTQKVGIIGKYSTRHGAFTREDGEKKNGTQHRKCTCSFRGKTKKQRRAVGLWHCGSCMKTVARGVQTYNTDSAITVRSAIRRLKELKRPVEALPSEISLPYNKWVNLYNNKKRNSEKQLLLPPMVG
ncbi:60S ribosomal protein L37a-like [Perognathus longimembris pacificus]|uniref:60S ribosomal protein L37a-like n=1 Tax=Perognathus longimembris pacificus TaxID=214514 RepID=UPI002019E594|nr:60S ribosomal protein L37a-like [Perognathus longimembris pacificus]